MLSRSAMALVTALLMFPQIAETIYSPALTDISAHFSVSAADAAQTLAVYFIGFAVGVLFWGWFSDRRGRRPALLLGLAVYTAGCMLALAAPDLAYCWRLVSWRLSARQSGRWLGKRCCGMRLMAGGWRLSFLLSAWRWLSARQLAFILAAC